MGEKWSTYGRTVVMVLVLVLVALRSAFDGDNHISSGEAVQIGVVAVTAFNTWLVPNLAYPWLKQVMIGVMAVLGLVVAALTDWRLTGEELTNLIIVFIGAVFGIMAPSNSQPVRGLAGYRAGPSRLRE